jgi:hypothetical protein
MIANCGGGLARSGGATRRLVLSLGMAILLFASSVLAQTPTRALTAIVLKATTLAAGMF